MSSGVDTPDDLKHCPQSAPGDLDLKDLSASQSSILYLLQEATKLATPSNRNGLGSEALHSKEEPSISMSLPCNRAPLNRKAQTESLEEVTGTFSVLSSVQTSSPWEVMSLINLQCERLLHCGQVHGGRGEDHTHAASKSDSVERANDMECSSSGPAVPSTSMVTYRVNTVDTDSGVFCSVPHIIDNADGLLSNQTTDELDCAKAEAVEDLTELISKNATDISHFSYAQAISGESSESCFLAEAPVVPLVVAKGCDQSPNPTEEGEMVNAASTSEAPHPHISSVDFTSSLVEGKDALCFDFVGCDHPEPQTVDASAVPPLSPQPDSASLSRTDLNNNLEEKLQVPGEDLGTTPSHPSGGSRRRTPRKQSHPARSPTLQDPELQGVTFSMHTELDRSTDQCRLLITSNFSELCRRGRRSRSSRSRSLQSSQRTSSSEEESDPASLSKKVCASCCTRKTPLWRDAEDGTPLCNACGIRYKKYRVRCLQCWNIPKKEANSNSKCLKCGDLLQLTSQNKRASW